jgi:hypothetical protein
MKKPALMNTGNIQHSTPNIEGWREAERLGSRAWSRLVIDSSAR